MCNYLCNYLLFCFRDPVGYNNEGTERRQASSVRGVSEELYMTDVDFEGTLVFEQLEEDEHALK